MLNKTLLAPICALFISQISLADYPAWMLVSQSGTTYHYQSVLSYAAPDFPDEYFNLKLISFSPPEFEATFIQFLMPPGTFEGTYFLSHIFEPVTVTINSSNPEKLNCQAFIGGTWFPIRSAVTQLYTSTFFPRVSCSNISPTEAIAVSFSVSFNPVNPTPTPSPTPTPTPTPQPSPTPPPVAYALKVIFNDTPIQDTVGNTFVAKILPSIEGCGALIPEFHQRSFRVQCIEKASGTPISGCRVGASLELGTDHGGHEHDSDTRPHGKISPSNAVDQLVDVPIVGLPMSYESPEVAGDVNVSLIGFDPNGRSVDGAGIQFQVTRGDFEALRAPGFQISVDSHPDGDRGTKGMQNAIEHLSSLFADSAALIRVNQVVKSEGGSLPHGGLFDYKHDKGSPWSWPHCGHRDGETADISYSIFDAYDDPARKLFLIVSMEQAFRDAGFRFVFEGDGDGKHWHIHLK